MLHTGARSLCDESVRYDVLNGCVVSVSEATKQFKQNFKKEKNYQDMNQSAEWNVISLMKLN